MSERVPFVDLRAQFRSIEPQIQAAIGEVLAQGDFILGPHLEAFEADFARFCGCSHAVGVSSGLDALRLALEVLNVCEGDEVIVPASTYIATALAVSAVGATLVLADCDAETGNLDPQAFRAAITSRTKAVIPVHLAGQPADMEAILQIAARHGVAVVEDAAQSHGAIYKGKAAGSMGILGCFSFYPGKNLGAYGDGGLVSTNDAALAEKLRRLRNYGQRAKYEHVEKGLNARLDGLQAAVLSVKLKSLDAWNRARAAHAAVYRRRLSGIGDLALQREEPGATSVHHLFFAETDSRDELQRHLSAAGVETGIHYPKPIHLQECYQDLGRGEGSFPNAERRARRTLSLPMFAELSAGQLDRVIGAVTAFYSARPAAAPR